MKKAAARQDGQNGPAPPTTPVGAWPKDRWHMA